MKQILTTAMLLFIMSEAAATDYYVSPMGNDTNSGSSRTEAWATLKKATETVSAGDNVYILPGTYQPSANDISTTDGLYAIVYDMNMQATADKPIHFIGLTENGERPVFDLSNVKPEGYRVTGFLVSGSYLTFSNFDVIGIQVTISTHTQSENFRITNGSHCSFENISCHDGMGIGFYISRRSSYNVIVNCDAYANYDSYSESGKGGNNDGFGCHVSSSDGVGNKFVGCRAWYNSDDGFDLINCNAAAEIAYCYAYYNGKSLESDGSLVSRADGNGIKAGGWGMSAKQITLPEEGSPMHNIHHNISALNKSNGIYSNHNLGGIWFHDNTSVRNSRYNYNFVNRQDASSTGNIDVNGYGHLIEHNLSYASSSKYGDVGWLNGGVDSCTIESNSFVWDATSQTWNNANLSDSDFRSVDDTRIIADRQSDGMLSELTLSYMAPVNTLNYGAYFTDYQKAVDEARIEGGLPTSIKQVTTTLDTTKDKEITYNLVGQQVDDTYKGIVVIDGSKFVRP